MSRGKVRELNLAAPPEVLTVNPGDTIRVTTGFGYTGPAISGTLYTALYHPSWYDPHDEIAHGTKAFSIPSSPTLRQWSGYADIRVPAGFIGTDFGLYTKIMGVPGEPRTGYYDNLIQIVVEGYILTVINEFPELGWVKIEPDKAAYGYGEHVKLTAIGVEPGFILDYWLINGVVKTANPITLTITQDTQAIVYWTYAL